MCIPKEACSRITFCDQVLIRLLKFQYCVDNQDFRNNTSSFGGRKFRSSTACFFFSGSLILFSVQNLRVAWATSSFWDEQHHLLSWRTLVDIRTTIFHSAAEHLSMKVEEPKTGWSSACPELVVATVPFQARGWTRNLQRNFRQEKM